MIKTTYQCDECEKDLGSKTHVHMDTRSNARIGIAIQQGNSTQWGIHKKLMPTIYHFCNGQCVGRYFTNLIKATKAKK